MTSRTKAVTLHERIIAQCLYAIAVDKINNDKFLIAKRLEYVITEMGQFQGFLQDMGSPARQSTVETEFQWFRIVFQHEGNAFIHLTLPIFFKAPQKVQEFRRMAQLAIGLVRQRYPDYAGLLHGSYLWKQPDLQNEDVRVVQPGQGQGDEQAGPVYPQGQPASQAFNQPQNVEEQPQEKKLTISERSAAECVLQLSRVEVDGLEAKMAFVSNFLSLLTSRKWESTEVMEYIGDEASFLPPSWLSVRFPRHLEDDYFRLMYNGGKNLAHEKLSNYKDTLNTLQLWDEHHWPSPPRAVFWRCIDFYNKQPSWSWKKLSDVMGLWARQKWTRTEWPVYLLKDEYYIHGWGHYPELLEKNRDENNMIQEIPDSASFEENILVNH